MVLTICKILVIGGVLLWKILCSDSTRFIEEGKEFILHCPQVNSSNSANWSRNGRNLSELIGNLSYHVTRARVDDSGVYTCTRSGFVEVFDVRVGRRPTVHRPVCFNSPNTTILCTNGAGNTPNTTVCLKVKNIFLGENEVGTQCNEGNVSFTLDLDEFYFHTFNFFTKMINPFGQRTRFDQFSRLGNKVIPHPPMYVEMTPDDLYSFNVSFTIPPSWKFGSNFDSKLLYSYLVTQDTLPSHHSEKRKVVKLPSFKLKVQRKPYSLVCLRVRLKYIYSDIWGEYSLPKCQRTTEAAPSTGPLSVAATSVQDKLNPGYRNVTITWEPPDERNRNGIIYQYSVTLEKETVEFTNDADNYDAVMRVEVNGNATQCTLTGIPSYQPFNITLKALTKMGASPGTTYNLEPLPERKDGINMIVWVLVGVFCLAIILASLRCFSVTRRKLFSEHLPEPIFIHPSKIPAFQSLPPQREVFDVLHQRPTSLQGASPHRWISDPSTRHGDWTLLNEGRNAFSGTDSGISCDTENFSTNQSCRCSELTRNRESNSVAEVCTYTGLPNDTSLLQWNESKFHHVGEPTFSGKCSCNMNGCNPAVPQNNSYSSSGYKRPPPPRVLGSEKWKYVPMNTGRREDICTGNCFVEDSVPKSDMEFEGYITMKSSIADDNEKKCDAMEMLEHKSLCERQKIWYKDEPEGERKIINSSRSVITLQEALADDEWNLTKLSQKDLVRRNHHTFRSCQNLKQICQEESTNIADKNVKESPPASKKCNTSREKDSNGVFTEDHELNSNEGLTSSRPASGIERDSGYTSDD